MIRKAKKMTTATVLAMMLSFGLIAAPATAQQTGLVNVQLGDVTILKNVNVGLALNVAANICGVSVNVLSSQLPEIATCEARGNNKLVQIIPQQ